MPSTPRLGGELLRLVTAGMYDNPLVLYREYIQNSADAIAAQGSGAGSVHVTIDPLQSQITIRDDGTGLEPDEAARVLIDLGHSSKNPLTDRGFRGIGRLSGLAFADELHFTTRTCADLPPTRVSWNARIFRELDLTKVDATTAIQETTTVSQVSSGEWPDRFFQVTIDRVNRHAASTLLNEEAVRNYLSEVCPVPLAPCFPLAPDILDFLKLHADYFVLDVRINDDPQPIERPFRDAIPLTEQFRAPFQTVDTHVIPRPDADEPAAILWLAHTPYAGSIPRRLGVRGLRARSGNMQIGTDRIFEHLFLEPRFNGWCVGEIHILDTRIAPNGRRDYFEPGPHLRNLENHIGAIAQQVSSRCRQASSQRNKLRNVNAAVLRFDAARNLARSGYLSSAEATALLVREQARIPAIRQTLAQVQAAGDDPAFESLSLCESEFESLELNCPPKLDTVPAGSRAAILSAFDTIARTLPPDSALALIEDIINQLRDREWARYQDGTLFAQDGL